ncbi:MAG: arginine--tRNA ligase [Bacteroidales bacterium]|nr:arginine--tRNA ligase [Bacteroidales bacterium]
MIFSTLQHEISAILNDLYSAEIESNAIKLEKTKDDFEGDLTLVVFPFLRISKKKPEQTAVEIGAALKDRLDSVDTYNIIKGFLNISFKESFWLQSIADEKIDSNYGYLKSDTTEKPIVLEYSSPNTNKPLHLGHVRNNLLGLSLAKVLDAAGKNVKTVNLINDRGIHICKTMLAWQKWGGGETPETAGVKGDHLIGKYYVLFDQKNKEEAAGGEENDTVLMKEAREMLIKWEENDAEVRALWQKLNDWVLAGFDDTYKRMGVEFNQLYFESQTYLSGKDIVLEGLKNGVLVQDEDQSIWIDLTNEKLDRKILLRSDGTSVYMTQDIGTAAKRMQDFNAYEMIYVVGNEQNYHFDVLKKTLIKLGFEWAENIKHFSYGMVELPEGKMKSREGTVVDADELMDEMKNSAAAIAKELGKADNLSNEEADRLYEMIGQAALKYFILKVDPKKNMMFNPEESIDFNGNTGPFIQYTHARINSLVQKAEDLGITASNWNTEIGLHDLEKDLLVLLLDLPQEIQKAADTLSPAIIANYSYDIAKAFNSMYQELSIVKEEDSAKQQNRLMLCKATQQTLTNSMALLGIELPERM